jgi:hypothetical protein
LKANSFNSGHLRLTTTCFLLPSLKAPGHLAPRGRGHTRDPGHPAALPRAGAQAESSYRASLCSRSMLLSGASPTQARMMFTRQARCSRHGSFRVWGLRFTVYGSGFGISGLGRVAGRAATWAKSALTMGEPGGTRGALMKKESTDKMGWKHSKSPWPLRRICSQKQGGVYRRRVG